MNDCKSLHHPKIRTNWDTFHDLCCTNDLASLRKILSEGHAIHVDDRGLEYAAQCGSIEVFQFLFEHPSKILCSNNANQSLFWSCLNGHAYH